ncbi:MAG: hypothetical protein R3F55_00230 [Alphaproteobacteria bacterium]
MGGTEFLISAGLGALQAIQSVAASRDDAAASRQQADAAVAQAAADAFEKRRAIRRDLGRARARLGAAGVTIEGSPVEVLTDLAAEGELEARRIESEGAAAARGHLHRAGQARSQAGHALLQGVDGLVGDLAQANRALRTAE